MRVIYGSHVIVFSSDPDADRAFLTDVLEFEHVDAGGGWLIFGLPPAELAVHPAEGPAAELYLMCDDLAAEMRRLEEKGVHVEELVLPDDVHDSLLFRNWLSSINAMSRFFEKTLQAK